MIRIKIIYDNISLKKGLKPAWGFAALINFNGKSILFDAGARSDVLLDNMKAMGISPGLITDVFISHNHWDHAGGLFGFLAKNHKVKIYLPISFSDTYHKEIKATKAKPIRVDGFVQIAKDLYSTGSLGKELKEQALIIDTPKGLVIVTGCAHPGILNIIKSTKKSLKKPIYAVIGGFHLGSKNVAEVNKIIAEFKGLGVAYAGPCHCTGKKAIKRFKAAYGKNFTLVKAGAGLIF